MKNNFFLKYFVGEIVLIRFSFFKKSRIALKRRFVLEGKVIKRNLRIVKYKIWFENLTTKSYQCIWVLVEDIISLIVEKEKRKKDFVKERLKSKGKNLNRKERLLSYRKKFYIFFERKDNYEVFWDQGFDISFNFVGDGNCQFVVVVYVL